MNQALISNIQTHYHFVREQIEKAAAASGRPGSAVRLVVVSKTQPLNVIQAALTAGILEFGENYAEEAVEKINAIGRVPGLTWHMIGHIQSRKASLVAQNFDFIHSVDSLKLATRLDRFAEEFRRKIPVLLECNVSGEESKNGFSAYDKESKELLFADINKLIELPNLVVQGLMTMPPLSEDPEDNRQFFRSLRELRDELTAVFPQVTWKELSMGTSSDFVTAVEEGATLVRIGTAILGSRPKK